MVTVVGVNLQWLMVVEKHQSATGQCEFMLCVNAACYTHARMHARAYGLYCMRNDSLWGLKCNVGVTLKPAMALLKG